MQLQQESNYHESGISQLYVSHKSTVLGNSEKSIGFPIAVDPPNVPQDICTKRRDLHGEGQGYEKRCMLIYVAGRDDVRSSR